MKSLRSSNTQGLEKFIETFDRFETAYARSQQPDVRSRYKRLLFESDRKGTFDRSMGSLFGDRDDVKSKPTRPTTSKSARVASTRGRSAENIHSVTMSDTPSPARRRLRPATAGTRPSTSSTFQSNPWQAISQHFLSVLFKAKCSDLKVEANSKQQKIFVSRLMQKLTPRKFIGPENGFGLESIKVISKFMRAHSSLIYLILDRNCLGGAAIKLLSQSLPQCSLIKLSLVSTNIPSSGASCLFESINHCPTLVQLNVSSCQGLYRNKLGAEGVLPLRQVLKKVETLHCLDVAGSSISAEGFKAICEGLNGNHSMCSLNVAKNQIKEELFSAMVPNLMNCSLTMLILAKNSIGDQGLIDLSEVLSSNGSRRFPLSVTLTTLDLRDNQITSVGFDFFCRQMTKNFTLEKLWLDHNYLSKGNRFQSFRMFVQSTKRLSFLSLRSIFLQTDDYVYLCQGMQYNTSIVQLDLSQNHLQKSSLGQICQFLRQNRTLRILHLDSCSLIDDYMPNLTDAIDKNKSLQQLFLKNNFIKDDGAKHLERILLKNKQLTGMKLEKNLISIQKQREIRRSLNTNTLVVSLQQPNLMNYDIKFEHNQHYKAELREAIADLRKKKEDTYRKNLQEEIMYFECAIEEAKKKLEMERKRLELTQSLGTFYTQHQHEGKETK